MSRPDVIIVGAGLAGLGCALRCLDHGLTPLVLEASDAPGGRVRTDEVDGFLLDRGFQVLLTAYPEAQRLLDYAALDLRVFYPGALVHQGTSFHRVADPWRHPIDGVKTVFAPVGSIGDKLRISQIRRAVTRITLDELWRRPDTTTLDALALAGVSQVMIDRFFRPFYGGIMLDLDLQTSSRIFDFTFRMFATGDTVVPARGMQQIPAQLAARLPEGALRLDARVVEVGEGFVRLVDGEEHRAPAVVIATDARDAARLQAGSPVRPFRAVSCLYFDAPASPVGEPIIVLNGSRSGPVNNLHVVSDVAPEAAPAGRALVSATVVGAPRENSAALERAVRLQLEEWYGPVVREWRHLRTYDIPYAHPDQMPPALRRVERDVRLARGRYICGDHVETATIHGALHSGRRAADAVQADFSA